MVVGQAGYQAAAAAAAAASLLGHQMFIERGTAARVSLAVMSPRSVEPPSSRGGICGWTRHTWLWAVVGMNGAGSGAVCVTVCGENCSVEEMN